MSVRNINIPYNFTLRQYQQPLWNAIVRGSYQRALVVWHRRAGKDKTFINIMVAKALQRPGAYFYILPYYSQARKIVWEGSDKDGFKNLDHFPAPLIKHKNNQEMILELQNGSIVRFLGSDNIDSIVGTNPIGIVFSEFSLHKTEAWNYLRPILLENEGWAIFNGTPRGQNQLYDMYRSALNDPSWYTSLLTIDDTNVLTPQQVEAEITAGMPRPLALQEFYCSFDSGLTGSYYAEQINRPHVIQPSIPHNPALPVWTSWDVGVDDETVIWFYQTCTSSFQVIDLLHDSNKGLDFYARALHNKPYVYSYHILPHDIRQRELSSGKSRLALLRSLCLDNVRVAPHLSLEEGIDQTRRFITQCTFSNATCKKGLEALQAYRADWNENAKTYGKPVHDWSSHYADALRMGAIGHITDEQNHATDITREDRSILDDLSQDRPYTVPPESGERLTRLPSRERVIYY